MEIVSDPLLHQLTKIVSFNIALVMDLKAFLGFNENVNQKQLSARETRIMKLKEIENKSEGCRMLTTRF